MSLRTGLSDALILFDLDGTLVDTTELILESFAYAFECHLPAQLPAREQLIATFGRSLPDTLCELAQEAGAFEPDSVGAAMLETYREFQLAHHDRLIRPIAGIEEALAALAAAGQRMGLVTSKMESFARRGLRQFGLEQYFELGVFHEDTDRHKPDPAPLLLAAERAAVPPGRTVYVGDSVHDVAAGRAAGMRTVAVLWGPFDRLVLESAGPDVLVGAPQDLRRLLSAR